MELLTIIGLGFINGIFALSEIALISVRKQRIAQLVEQGNKRALIVLELQKDPEAFLSAVQIGITLIGIVSGVYGGATLTDNFKPVLETVSWLKPYAGEVAYVLVVALITYLSIIIGELIPKTLAMKYAEPVALAIAGFIRIFSRISSPLVWILTTSTRIIFGIFGVRQSNGEEKITEEELRYAIKTAGSQGLFDQDESEIQYNVLGFSDLRAKSVMTHRLDVEWIDITDDPAKIEAEISESNHNQFPVCEDGYDNILGYIHIKDYLRHRAEPGFSLRSILREPVYVSENQYAIDILRVFKKSRCYFSIVVDEFGAFEGIITLHDLAEALVGDLPDDEQDMPEIVRRDDGTLLVNAAVPIGDLNHYLNKVLVPEKQAYYNTLAGFIIHHLERIPDTGDKFVFQAVEFEIVDKDGVRIDQVLIRLTE